MEALFSADHLSVQATAMTATFILCLSMGLERHVRHKDAGIKTHVLVGLGSCLFTLVSTYGFAPITGPDIAVDPSRVAAQIVSGIGFLGAGVIFVNNDTVRGLTTAATVWLSAAIGMACGSGMILLGIIAVILDYLVVFAVGPLASRMQGRRAELMVRIDYEVGRAIMPEILQAATASGFTATLEETRTSRTEHGRMMNAVMRFHGSRSVPQLIADLSGIDGIERIEHLEDGGLD